MQFREWFFLIESKEEKTLAKELAGDSYDALNSVIPQNTKESDPLLLLAAYYLTQSKNIAQTKQDIQEYIALVKNNKMPLIKVDLNNKNQQHHMTIICIGLKLFMDTKQKKHLNLQKNILQPIKTSNL